MEKRESYKGPPYGNTGQALNRSMTPLLGPQEKPLLCWDSEWPASQRFCLGEQSPVAAGKEILPVGHMFNYL